MDAEQLYDEMKAALNLFGLRFNEKDQMGVSFSSEGVTFTYRWRGYFVPGTEPEEDPDGE